MTGWLKIHRQLMHSPVFENEKIFKTFMYCLMKATHKEHDQLVGRTLVHLKVGQFVFGRNKASLEMNMKPSTLWDNMQTLKLMGNITIKSNNKFSVVTVVNWATYQQQDDEADNKTNNKTNNKPTTNQQQSDNKPTTNQQQSDTNKNVKNEKNVENVKNDNKVVGNTLDILKEQKINQDHNPNKNIQLRELHIKVGDEELIKAAKIANERNSPNVGYVLGILKNVVEEKKKPATSNRADFLKNL